MGINLDKPHLWKADTAKSVDMYNEWFMNFSPKAFRDTRKKTASDVEFALHSTENLSNVTPALLKEHPRVLPMLRMSTCPPIARDRLIGLSGISKNLVKCMEDAENPRIPPRMAASKLNSELLKIGAIIVKMADPDIFVWLNRKESATKIEISRAATIVADRLCGSLSDPIIRNEQEKRQLTLIEGWLKKKGYKQHAAIAGVKFNQMSAGTYAFHMNVPVNMNTDNGEEAFVNVSVDVVIMPLKAKSGDLPLLIEAKSAGDFTNVNKRRKEEAQKMTQLRNTYGDKIRFGLFLCGYFDGGYLGYEAQEGIDWVWEHRIDDLAEYGI